MEDTDDVKRLIEDRLRELRLEGKEVSLRIGKNPGYLHDYLRKGSPRALSAETKLALAAEMQIPPSRLGLKVAHAGAVGPRPGTKGFEDDAVPYQPGPHDPRLPDGMFYYTMRSNVMEMHPLGITAEIQLVMDGNRVEPADLATGDVIVGQRIAKDDAGTFLGTIVREFVRPNKLITNMRGANEIWSIEDPAQPFNITLRGALHSVYRRAR